MFSLKRSTKEKIQISIVYAGLLYGIVNCIITGSWWLFAVSIALAVWHGMFGNNIALHRLFSHRSFTTSRPKEIFLAISSIFLGSNGPITYCAIHRHHHVHSDYPRDPHSPKQSGRWYIAFAMWAFRDDYGRGKLGIKLPKDLMRDNVLKFIELQYYKIWTALMVLFYVVGGMDALIYFLLAPAGIYVLIANTGTNVIAHSNLFKSSYRNFDCDDDSHNSNFVQLLTLGEGYQNNHHHNCTTCSQAVKPGEFDPAAWIVRKFFAKTYI